MNLKNHLELQKKWSLETFGPGPKTLGLIDHIKKELQEIQAEPHDLEEWIDVVILAFDGAIRAGHEPEKIVDALVKKTVTNMLRKWPDWRTADPDKAIEHIKETEE